MRQLSRHLLVPLLLSATAAARLAGAETELALVGMNGEREVVTTLSDFVFAPRLSPDGERFAFDDAGPEEGSAQVFIASLDDPEDRLALPIVDGPLNYAAVWTPDGERIVFVAPRPDGDRLYWRRADGSGDAEHLIDARAPEVWLAGGRELTYLTREGDGDYGISALDVESLATRALVDLPGSAEHSGAVSPNGRLLAYASNETGRYEVWLAPLPPTRERTQLTTEGGGHPLWAPDGRTVYFQRDNRLYRIGVDPETDEAAGPPEALPIEGFLQGELRRRFDLTPDGERFLMLFPAGDGGRP